MCILIVLHDRFVAEEGCEDLLADVHETVLVVLELAEKGLACLWSEHLPEVFFVCLQNEVVIEAREAVIHLACRVLEKLYVVLYVNEEPVYKNSV